MQLLLDTHVLLWWQRDDRQLKKAAREAIARAEIVYVSAVSGWELTIKAALGRVRLAEPFPALLAADDFTELPMTLAHAEALAALPAHHSDPFDRALIAQARVERLTIVSHDRALAPYGAHMLWT